MVDQAPANDEEHYAIGFEGAFNDAVIDRLLQDQRISVRLQDDPRFRQIVKDYIRPRVYERQRTPPASGAI